MGGEVPEAQREPLLRAERGWWQDRRRLPCAVSRLVPSLLLAILPFVVVLPLLPGWIREGWLRQAFDEAGLPAADPGREVPPAVVDVLMDGLVSVAVLAFLLVPVCLVLLILVVRLRAGERTACRRLEEALDVLEHGFALYDAEDRLVICNRAYREIYPRSAARMVPSVTFAELIRYGVEQGEYLDARDDPEGWIAARLAFHQAADGTPMLQRLADGRILKVSEHRTPDGGRVGLRVDVTALEHSRRALEESEGRFRALAEHAPIGIWQLDAQGRTVYANPALRRMLDCDPRDPAELQVDALLPTETAALLRRLLAGDEPAAPVCFELELPEAQAEGLARALVVAATRLTTSDGGLLLILLDVTAQKRALAEVEHLALHDPLTGLGNRRLFEREVDARLQKGDSFALVLVDVDDLEEFNARFGHREGDHLLGLFAERLRQFVRSGDRVFRLGGDEFALLVPGIADCDTLSGFTERLLAALEVPFVRSGRRVHPRACLGGVLAPLHARSRETLLAQAELALTTAKQRGPGQTVLYEPGLAIARRRRIGMRRRIERAIERDELQLVVQPQIALADGRVCGGEVLLRWFDPVEKEPVPPAEFIALAEETGLIFRLDAWVLEHACAWLAGCGLAEDRLPRLAVNVSAAHISRPELPRLVDELLARYGLVPSRLELELTESVILDDRALGRRLLDQLHETGVELALDDFGTGYSSLSYLADLPFDRIKIDRSFVLGLEASSRHRTLVRAIVGLGHGLGMQVVAEGVETVAQRDLLLKEGCDLAQGHLITRPMPLVEFAAWLRDWDPKGWRQEAEAVQGHNDREDGQNRWRRVGGRPTRE